MAPSHTKVASRLTLSSTLLCLCLFVLSGNVSAKTFSWRGFCLSPGPPFLPPAFLSLPVITTCFSCPHGMGLCSRKQGRGRVGGLSCITKAGHWPRASSHRGSEPEGRGGGMGPPSCSHFSPSQAAFLLALAAWPPERNLPFRVWLSLAKNKTKNLGTLPCVV